MESNVEIKIGSDKSFGILFAVVFAIVAAFPLLDGGAPRWWALAIGLGFLAAALAAPHVLAPLNRLWFRFGMLLSRIVSPVVMAVLFFLTVTPIGLVMRMLGTDPLKQRFEPEARSYWIEPARDAPSSMKNQF